MSRDTRAPAVARGAVVNGAQSDLFARARTPSAATRSKSPARSASKRHNMDASLPLTAEQMAIVEAAISGEALAVEAGAGSGKTTTCVAVARALGKRRGVLVVYNAIAAQATKGRLQSTGCEARTLHSIAFRSPLADPIKRGDRLTMALPARAAAEAANIRYPQALGTNEDHVLSATAQGYLIKDWVDNFCHSADDALGPQHFPWGTFRAFSEAWLATEVSKGNDEREVITKAARDIGGLLEGAARRLWEKMSGPGDFPSSHDVYLKLYVMSRPRVGKDYLLLDEAQDANPLALQFFNLAREQGCQTIAVGDSHQQLYAWRGAVDAMRQIGGHRHLALTQCFRFGPAVAEVANRILAIGGSDFRISGAGGPTRVDDDLDAPTAVICRTNAVAIETALRLADRGRDPALCLDRMAMLREVDNLERFASTGKSSARRYCAFQSFDELLECINELPDVKILWKLAKQHGFAGTRAIIDRLAVGKNQASIEASGRDVTCLTTHAAKGLEFRRVRLAHDFSPQPNEEKQETEAQWLKRLATSHDDLNIFYVAVTRAQDALGLGESSIARLLTGRPVFTRPAEREDLEPEDEHDLGRGG